MKMAEKTVTKGKIQYADMEIPYELIQSGRKSYAIQISPGGRVVIRTPLKPSASFLSQLFREKEKWITTKYRESRAVVPLEEDACSEVQRHFLESKYRRAAQEYVPRRVAFYQTLVGGAYKKIVIREQKTRWGSCSGRGTLSFNWRLMLAPPKVLDYVVVHELCHLLHMNHSKDFWNAVERVMPDYREYRNWLKEHGRELQRQFQDPAN